VSDREEAMITWFTLGIGLTLMLASAPDNHAPQNEGPVLLVLPKAGAPLSFEQTQEHSAKRADGTTVVQTLKSTVYRDSSGRVMIRGEFREGAGQSPNPYQELIDPVQGLHVVLLVNQKIGYRVAWSTSQEGQFFSFFATGQGLRSENPTVNTENLGVREIEGIKFNGIRFIHMTEGKPHLRNTIEQWYSDDLKLLGVFVSSSDDEVRTVRIHNVRRQEPDPELFVTPADYQIIDSKLTHE